MVSIPRFETRWAYYKTRASRIVPQHFPVGKKVTYEQAARWIPSDDMADFPAGNMPHMEGAAFGYWIAKEHVPSGAKREEHFASLTGVPIADWATEDDATFERAVRRAAGEVQGWAEMVQARGRLGGIVIRLQDYRAGQVTQRDQVARDKFIHAEPGQAAETGVVRVWPNCIARIEVPAAAPAPEAEDRRVWMLADYGPHIYVLDPTVSVKGEARSTRIDRHVWRPRGAAGYVLLPRSEPDYVWLRDTTPLDTQFDVQALVMNLDDQPEEVRAQFDALERRLRMDTLKTDRAVYQKTVRQVLDEAASLLQAQDVWPTLYRQTCKVGPRPSQGTAVHE
jgi:hypothetical protein